MDIKNISTLKIHKLTQEQYDREEAAGRLEEDAIYLTPDEPVDLSGYATEDYVNTQVTTNLNALVGNTKVSEQISTAIGKLTAADVGALPNTTVIPSIEGLATETYVDNAVADLVESAPETLNTLNELAAALGDDPNFATTVATQIGKKPGKIVTGETFIIDGISNVAYTGAEIFNDYSKNIAIGVYSHAEGRSTIASGYGSHAEGNGTIASGEESHAEGIQTIASGSSSHSEGSGTTASGYCSHAEGHSTYADGKYSHAEGYGTHASGENQHTQGRYNIRDFNNTYAHIVGNGEFVSDANKITYSNAHTLDWDGNAWFAGDVYIGSTSGTNRDEGSKKLVTESYVDEAVSSIEHPIPDWNAAEGEVGHVLNRTHWVEESVTIILPETTGTQNTNPEIYNLIEPVVDLVAGETYYITVNGEKYEAICEDSGIIGFGLLSDELFSDIPFAIMTHPVKGTLSIQFPETSNPGYAVVEITQAAGSIIHKLPEEFLPDGLATESYVDTAITGLVSAPTNATAGDLLMYDGTNWTKISKADLIAEIIAALPSAEEAEF